MVWPTVFSEGVVERKRYGGLPAILQQPHPKVSGLQGFFKQPLPRLWGLVREVAKEGGCVTWMDGTVRGQIGRDGTWMEGMGRYVDGGDGTHIRTFLSNTLRGFRSQ